MNLKELVEAKKGQLVKTSEFIDELGWSWYSVLPVLDNYHQRGKITYKLGIGEENIPPSKAFFTVGDWIN